MHGVTSALFCSKFLRQSWLSATNKAKLLEYKDRKDLAQYSSRGAPELLPSGIRRYEPKLPHASDWKELFQRANLVDDVCHVSKLVQALCHAGAVCEPFNGRSALPIQAGMWLSLGNMGG